MFLPFILIKTFNFLESLFILLFPLALVTSITLTGILLYLGAFTFLVLFFIKEKKDLPLSEFSFVHSAFLIYIFTFALSKYFNSALYPCIHSFFRTSQDYFVFLWVLSFVVKHKKNEELVKYAIIVAGLISIIYGFFQFCHLDFFHRQTDVNKLSGFHTNPYSFAGQLIVFFFLFLNESKLKFKNIFFYLMLIACLFCILNTIERAVIFSVLLGLFIYVIMMYNKENIFIPILTLLFVPLGFAIFLNKKLFNKMKNLISVTKGVKQNVRFKIWDIAINVWKRNIIFGVGAFPTLTHQGLGAFQLKYLTHAHNVYLQILVINGLVGLLSFLYLFFSILRTLFFNLKTNSYAPCLIATLIAFFIEGFFEYFWGDTEVRYLLLYFIGFVFGTLLDFKIKRV